VTDGLVSPILSLGLSPAVPLAGSWIMDRWLPGRWGIDRIPIATSIGLAVWSVPLLGLLIARVYSPALLGSIGWVVAALLAARLRPTIPARVPIPSLAGAILIVGLGIASAIYVAFPADPTTTVRDMAVYAVHADYMAHHGRQDVPYPAGLDDPRERRPPGSVEFAGVYGTQPTMTVQFGHLYPAWLAQVFGVLGFEGVIRANAVLAVLAALAVFGVARRVASPPIAALAAVTLALNPSQVWTTHNTLTEIMTQLLIWSAFLCLVAAPPQRAPRAGAIAGLLLGVAAVVRIDSLVLVPMLLLAGATVRVVDDRSPAWRAAIPLWLASTPVFVIATAYYAGFTEPYFRHLSPQLLQIAAAAVAAAAVVGVTAVEPLRRWIGRVVRARAVVIGVGIGLLALIVYAYFVRPSIGPFAVIEDTTFGLGGTRSYIEDALPNLGRYLSPPVVWFGLLGWLALLLREVHGGRTWLLPVVVVTGGYAALYFWNQSIFPDHFWAIRRFIPIVVPAVVVFAAAGLWLVLQRMPSVGRVVAITVLALGLGAYTWRVGGVAATTAERAGDYRQLEQFASELPSEPIYLGLFDSSAGRGFGLPLALAFDRQLIPLDVMTPAGRAEALDRLARASDDEPLMVITSLVDDADALAGAELAHVKHTRPAIAAQLHPVPSTVSSSTFELLARRVTGFAPVAVRFGGQSSWWVTATGFEDPELIDGTLARWTNGSAEVRIPLFTAAPAGSLRIEVLATGPDGNDLVVTANGIEVVHQRIGPGSWSAEVELPPTLLGAELIVAVESDTFVPSQALPGSTDDRTLGVLVSEIEWRGRD
jgi:hypothetical protein